MGNGSRKGRVPIPLEYDIASARGENARPADGFRAADLVGLLDRQPLFDWLNDLTLYTDWTIAQGDGNVTLVMRSPAVGFLEKHKGAKAVLIVADASRREGDTPLCGKFWFRHDRGLISGTMNRPDTRMADLMRRFWFFACAHEGVLYCSRSGYERVFRKGMGLDFDFPGLGRFCLSSDTAGAGVSMPGNGKNVALIFHDLRNDLLRRQSLAAFPGLLLCLSDSRAWLVDAEAGPDALRGAVHCIPVDRVGGEYAMPKFGKTSVRKWLPFPAGKRKAVFGTFREGAGPAPDLSFDSYPSPAAGSLGRWRPLWMLGKNTGIFEDISTRTFWLTDGSTDAEGEALFLELGLDIPWPCGGKRFTSLGKTPERGRMLRIPAFLGPTFYPYSL